MLKNSLLKSLHKIEQLDSRAVLSATIAATSLAMILAVPRYVTLCNGSCKYTTKNYIV